jgi:hypothetical protein
MAGKIIKFLDIDITAAILEDFESLDVDLTPSIMFNAAFRPDTLSVKELKKLRKELADNPEKYEDIIVAVQESSGDKIKDMLAEIDYCIKEKENGTYITDVLY